MILSRPMLQRNFAPSVGKPGFHFRGICRSQPMRGKNKGKYRMNREYIDEDFSDYDDVNIFGMSPFSRSAPVHASIDLKSSFPPKLQPKNDKQAEYLRMLNCPQTHIILATGCAGTGKTFVSTSWAMEKLQAGEIKKIVITRPMVSVEDKNFGAVPGDVKMKALPYMMPIMDVIHKYISPAQFNTMYEKGIIEICPLIFMRGRSFESTVIIADEMQNSTPNQMLMLLTRIGQGSKMIIDGDPMQHDRGFEHSGLVDLMEKLERHPQDGFGKVHFTEEEVERHPMVKKVLRLYHTKAIPSV